ncbi:MAG: sulfatase-like hydrolase/transferase [Akkermansiaceae bacterium]|nr:sulfatase-like hydrolase/transferase [Akkermansiaceae bacterium]
MKILVPAILVCLTQMAFANAPNILFILADDQSWNGTSVPMIPGDASSASRQFRTPNLETLAAQGMIFSQAYAAHCKCECSRASLQMGRTTTTLNAPDKMSRYWSAPVTDSLANSLKRADSAYRAAHFGKWQWFHSPESMGYDASDGITMNEDGNSTDPADPKLSFSLTRKAGDFMTEQVRSGHPFFLQMSYYAVHPVGQALPETMAKYRNPGGGGAGGGRGDRAILAAMTEDLDTCVGALLRKLDELKIAENTLVIYTSDNGGRTGLLKGGKGDLGEGGLRVPLIVRGPGIPAGSFSHIPVISYDLIATVLDFAAPGSLPPSGQEGGSWKPLLLSGGKVPVKRPIDRFVWHQAVEIEHPQSAIRMGDWKLLHYWDTQETQLYHIATDPGEAENLASENPDKVAAMGSQLTDHLRAGLGEAAFGTLERGEMARDSGRPRPKRPAPVP